MTTIFQKNTKVTSLTSATKPSLVFLCDVKQTINPIDHVPFFLYLMRETVEDLIYTIPNQLGISLSLACAELGDKVCSLMIPYPGWMPEHYYDRQAYLMRRVVVTFPVHHKNYGAHIDKKVKQATKTAGIWDGYVPPPFRYSRDKPVNYYHQWEHGQERQKD